MAGYAPPNVSFTSPNAGGADNPYSAKFYATQAALNSSLEKGLAEEKVGAEHEESAYKLGLFENAKTEGNALRAGGQKANTEGLAESGQLAQRQGTTQSAYAEKAGTLGTNRRNAIEKYQNDAATKQLSYGEKTATNVGNAEAEGLKYSEEHPPAIEAAAPAAPSVPTPSAAALASGAPRVVGVKAQPNTPERGPRIASIKAQPTTTYRKTAVEKAKLKAGI